MALFQHWTTVSKKVVFETRLLSSLSNDIPNEPLDIPLGVLFPLLLTRFPWGHVRNCRQWINSQQHPALSKDLITGSRAGYCPYFRNISVGCHLWLLHTATQTFFYLRKGAAAPLLSRVSASLRSIPPLSLRNGQALDCIHPAGKKARIGLSPKALSFYFPFPAYLAIRGRTSPGTSLLLFWLGWRTFGLAGGADSVKPCLTRGGHPKGLGLEGIRGAS
jgi:hypothetical protein